MSYFVCRLAFFFLFYVLSTGAAAQVPVRASYGSLGLSQVILPLGVRSGIFQKNGLKIESVYIAGMSVSALIGGDVQFGFMGGPPPILARLGGMDVVIIAGLNGLDQILVSAPSIKKASDLIGKRVGISRFGTTADYGARIALKRFKLQPQKDVVLIQLGDTTARIGGILSGAVHAASLTGGEKEYALKLGFNILTDNADVEFPGNTVVTTRSYLNANREHVKRFVKGLVEVIHFVKAESEKTKGLLKKIYRQSDESIIGKRYEALVSLFPDYPYITRNAIQSFLDILWEEGKLKERTDSDMFMDMSFLREVEEAERQRNR